jgi:hypothetical protein
MPENPEIPPQRPKAERNGMRTALLAAAKMKEIAERAKGLSEKHAQSAELSAETKDEGGSGEGDTSQLPS